MKQYSNKTIQQLRFKLLSSLIFFSLFLVGNLFLTSQAFATIQCSRCSTVSGCTAVTFNTNDSTCSGSSQPIDTNTNPRAVPSTFCGTTGSDANCSQPKLSPIGYLDAPSSSNDIIRGWACDPSNNFVSPVVAVHLYFGGPAGSGNGPVGAYTVTASRPDVAGACGGQTARGWEALVPDWAKTGSPTTVYAYAIDNGDAGVNPLLNYSASQMTFNTYACGNRCSNTKGCAQTNSYRSYDAGCNNPVPGTLNYSQNIACGPKNQGDDSWCPAPTYTVSGRVWKDTNGNGVLDGGEASIPGQAVYIEKLNSTATAWLPYETAITNASGVFTFTSVYSQFHLWTYPPPGGYTITSPGSNPGQGYFSGSAGSSCTISPAVASFSCVGGNITGANFGAKPPAPAPIINSFTVDNNPIAPDQLTHLRWTTSNATTCSVNQGVLPTRATTNPDSTPIAPHSTITVTLTCSGPGGTVNSLPLTITVTVPPPTLTFSSSATTVPWNTPVTLSWTTTYANSCARTCSGDPAACNSSWTGNTSAANGSYTTLPLTSTTTYTMNCSGTTPPAVNKSVTITVGAAPPVPFVQTHGVIFNAQNPQPPIGNLSKYHWLVGTSSDNDTGYGHTKPLAFSYSTIKSNAGQANQTIETRSDPSISLSSPFIVPNSKRLIEFTNDVHITSGDIKINSQIFILGDHDIYIDGSISTDTTSILVIAAKGDIIVNKNIRAGSPPTCSPNGQLQGIFSAGGNFRVEGYNTDGCKPGGTKDLPLIINGTVITNAEFNTGGELVNNRDLCEYNLSVPAVSIQQRPDFIINMPDFAKNPTLIYKEVNP